MRRDLMTKSPGAWEVYNVVDDPAETTNLAEQNPEIIVKARAILREQTSPNEQFSLAIDP